MGLPSQEADINASTGSQITWSVGTSTQICIPPAAPFPTTTVPAKSTSTTTASVNSPSKKSTHTWNVGSDAQIG